MRIAIIGCGEVGTCYARALAAVGHRLVLIDVRTSPALLDLGRQLDARVHHQAGAHLAQVDVVISAVYGGVAQDTAAHVMPWLRQGAVYADFTTASPDAMRATRDAARAHGVHFVDVAIMGTMRLTGAQTPLVCAGADCQVLLSVLSAAEVPIRNISARPGDAASLKLLRSIMTKGMEALAVECLVAAQRQGLRDALFDVLDDVDRTYSTRPDA